MKSNSRYKVEPFRLIVYTLEDMNMIFRAKENYIDKIHSYRV